jgi:hypothetical protein
MVLRQGVDIGIPIRQDPGIFQRVEHVSLLHIVRIEPMAVAS